MPVCLDSFPPPNVVHHSKEIAHESCIDTMEQEIPKEDISVSFIHQLANAIFF
jgi:hypothetical protein